VAFFAIIRKHFLPRGGVALMSFETQVR
jgi:hypothetical protein